MAVIVRRGLRARSCRMWDDCLPWWCADFIAMLIPARVEWGGLVCWSDAPVRRATPVPLYVRLRRHSRCAGVRAVLSYVLRERSCYLMAPDEGAYSLESHSGSRASSAPADVRR